MSWMQKVRVAKVQGCGARKGEAHADEDRHRLRGGVLREGRVEEADGEDVGSVDAEAMRGDGQ